METYEEMRKQAESNIGEYLHDVSDHMAEVITELECHVSSVNADLEFAQNLELSLEGVDCLDRVGQALLELEAVSDMTSSWPGPFRPPTADSLGDTVDITVSELESYVALLEQGELEKTTGEMMEILGEVENALATRSGRPDEVRDAFDHVRKLVREGV